MQTHAQTAMRLPKLPLSARQSRNGQTCGFARVQMACNRRLLWAIEGRSSARNAITHIGLVCVCVIASCARVLVSADWGPKLGGFWTRELSGRARWQARRRVCSRGHGQVRRAQEAASRAPELARGPAINGAAAGLRAARRAVLGPPTKAKRAEARTQSSQRKLQTANC